jgi:hypothetical protein
LLRHFINEFCLDLFQGNSIGNASLIIRKIFTFKGPLFIDVPSLIIYSFLAIGLYLPLNFLPSFTHG